MRGNRLPVQRSPFLFGGGFPEAGVDALRRDLGAVDVGRLHVVEVGAVVIAEEGAVATAKVLAVVIQI